MADSVQPTLLAAEQTHRASTDLPRANKQTLNSQKVTTEKKALPTQKHLKKKKPNPQNQNHQERSNIYVLD